MTIHPCQFSSKTREWPTPQSPFDTLDEEFHFTLDPYATPTNAKCATYFTRFDDGLSQSWAGHRVFRNPSYGCDVIKWAEKSYRSSQEGALVVLLVPARTDTRWFHNWVYRKADIRFIRGRLKFGDARNSAPFASILAIYRPKSIAQSIAQSAVVA